MYATLLIYRDDETVNEIALLGGRSAIQSMGYTFESRPGASRLERLRDKLIHETEQYLSDGDGPTWARAPLLKRSPVA